MNKVQPISPEEVTGQKQAYIPDGVIKTFNRLIAENFSNGVSIVFLKEVLAGIREELNISNNQLIFSKRFLDIEDIYRQAGWKVFYDNPGYNESYEPSFKFSKS